MSILFSYSILLVYCLLGLVSSKITANIVAGFLLTIFIVTVSYALQSKKISRILLYTYAIMSFFYPALLYFLPMLFPEIGQKKEYPCIALIAVSLFYNIGTDNIARILFLLLGCAIGLFLQYLIQRYEALDAKHRKMRDDSTELNLLLKQRNRSLLEKQDYEIHNATLQERNRIAREIHDNVGHLLSRCILLNGALQTINQDENCKESLRILQDTLSQAMDNIRSSVHNLHDDSINLRGSLENLIRDFTFCPAHLEYDLSQNIPSNIRYALISITKEALTNISKHSNATNVQIIMREHPAMYQLSIWDNGKTKARHISLDDTNRDTVGIGLINMQDRVKMLGGIFQIHTDDGFQIFASIPKKKE